MEAIKISDMAVTKVTQSETETEAGTKTKWAYVLDDGNDRKLTLVAAHDYGIVVGQKFSVTLKNPQTRLDDCQAGKTQVEVLPDSAVTEASAEKRGVEIAKAHLNPEAKRAIQDAEDLMAKMQRCKDRRDAEEAEPQLIDDYCEKHDDASWILHNSCSDLNYKSAIPRLTDEELDFCIEHEHRSTGNKLLVAEKKRRARTPAATPSVIHLKDPESPGSAACLTTEIDPPRTDNLKEVTCKQCLMGVELRAAADKTRVKPAPDYSQKFLGTIYDYETTKKGEPVTQKVGLVSFNDGIQAMIVNMKTGGLHAIKTKGLTWHPCGALASARKELEDWVIKQGNKRIRPAGDA